MGLRGFGLHLLKSSPWSKVNPRLTARRRPMLGTFADHSVACPGVAGLPPDVGVVAGFPHGYRMGVMLPACGLACVARRDAAGMFNVAAHGTGDTHADAGAVRWRRMRCRFTEFDSSRRDCQHHGDGAGQPPRRPALGVRQRICRWGLTCIDRRRLPVGGCLAQCCWCRREPGWPRTRAKGRSIGRWRHDCGPNPRGLSLSRGIPWTITRPAGGSSPSTRRPAGTLRSSTLLRSGPVLCRRW